MQSLTIAVYGFLLIYLYAEKKLESILLVVALWSPSLEYELQVQKNYSSMNQSSSAIITSHFRLNLKKMYNQSNNEW